MSQNLTHEGKQWLYSLNHRDVTMTLLKENFASINGEKPKRKFTDYFVLESNKLGNKKTITTTVGRYIFNLLVFTGIRDKIEYFNIVLNQKGIDNVFEVISTALIEDKIDVDQYKNIVNKIEWLGYGTVTFTAPSFSDEDLICPPKTAKLRKDLFSKYAKELENQDIIIGAMIEKEIVDSAKKELKEMNSPIIDFYESGTCKKFENGYKNMALLRGVTPKFGKPGEYQVGISNLVDGTTEDEFAMGVNIFIEGAAGRGIETAVSGYLSKQLTAAFQAVEVGEEGVDCGTKGYLEILLTEKNHSEYIYTYIFENGKSVLLDSKNINNYIGKRVKWRNPMFCKSEKYCEFCYGRLPYTLDIKNVGITFNIVGERFKNLSMKAFHDLTVKLGDLDLSKIIHKEK